MGVSSLRIIVTGLIGQHPRLGGVTWFHIQYMLGLARLGHDVYYLEDSGEWPYVLDGGPSGDDWVARDPAPNVEYLAAAMSRFGMENKWAYRYPLEPRWFGLSERKRQALIESADILINVSGTLEHPEKYRRVPRLVFIDTDPVFTQVKLAGGDADFCRQVNSHDIHFSFGECLSPENVPDTGHCWRPTRTPVELSEWHPSAPQRGAFTTIMNWTSYEPESYGGRNYGQKDVEFRKFMDLPRRVAPIVLEVAMGMGVNEPTPYDLLREKGWRLVDPLRVCPDLESLRTYTESSRGEWSVAKNGYVVGRSGWFSERSARYLAAGRPVVLQDTGFSKTLPVGEGILPFTNMEESVAAIQAVQSDYVRHSRAARAIAEEYFDSRKVLSQLIERAQTS
ncbi:MAG TPA: hypothetical protein VES59_06350 [Bacteroidota bacterium]|nr:hypothetical protein [Bacteroidota bacterium]